MEARKEDAVQAIVLMETFNDNFWPVSKYQSMAFLTVAGAPLIEHALQQLAYGGITKAILFCSKETYRIQKYLKDNKGLWKYIMDVQIHTSYTCKSVGDVMREINATLLVSDDFIFLGINSVTNIDFAALLEQHRQNVKKHRRTAMTLVYKLLTHDHSLVIHNKSFYLTTDAKTRKVLVYQKLKSKFDKQIDIPVRIFRQYPNVTLHHSLVDPNIAVCSPSVPSLFTINDQFRTRDDFIRGVLYQENILLRAYVSIYSTFVESSQFAAAVTNWKTYQTICSEVLHTWTYSKPIVPDTRQEFVPMGKNIYVNKTATLSRSCNLENDVLIGGASILGDNTTISNSFIGNNVTIGKNVTIERAYIMDKVVIKDNVKISLSFIDEKSCINKNCDILGSVIAQKRRVHVNAKLNGAILEKDTSTTSDADEKEKYIGFNVNSSDCESYYSSDSTPDFNKTIPKDPDMFLTKVIECLTKWNDHKLFQQDIKLKGVILEINDLKRACNITSREVNFYVVRAILSLPQLLKEDLFALTLEDAISFFHPIFKNYIKNKTAKMDCLKAVKETFEQPDWVSDNSSELLQTLLDADIVDKDSFFRFFLHLRSSNSIMLKHKSVQLFFNSLNKHELDSGAGEKLEAKKSDSDEKYSEKNADKELECDEKSENEDESNADGEFETDEETEDGEEPDTDDESKAHSKSEADEDTEDDEATEADDEANTSEESEAGEDSEENDDDESVKVDEKLKADEKLDTDEKLNADEESKADEKTESAVAQTAKAIEVLQADEKVAIDKVSKANEKTEADEISEAKEEVKKLKADKKTEPDQVEASEKPKTDE